MRNSLPAKYAVLLVCTALLVTGCFSTDTGSKPTLTRTVSGVPKTSTPPAPTAANGSNVTACKDARCEVLIHGTARIPLARKFGCSRFSVTYNSPNEVVYTIVRTSFRNVRFRIAGDGHLSLVNGVTVDQKLLASGAILRFSPGTEDKKNDKGWGTKGFSITTYDR